MTKQGNPDDRSRALLRGYYMKSLEDGSFSNHTKKDAQKYCMILWTAFMSIKLVSRGSIFFSTVREVRVL